MAGVDGVYYTRVGSTLQLNVFKNNELYTNVTYVVANNEVADVSDTGLLTAKQAGVAIVNVTDKANTELTAGCEIGIDPANFFVFGAGDATSVEAGKTLQMIVTKDGQMYANVRYDVNPDSVASIDNTGLLTGKAEGVVTVTAIDNESDYIRASKEFTVTPAQGNEPEQPQEYLIIFGEADRTTIDTPGGTLKIMTKKLPEDIDFFDVTYSVDRADLATIDPNTGILTAVADGIVTVTGTATNGSGLSATLIVTISNQDLEIGVGNLFLNINNETQQYVASGYITYADRPENMDSILINTVLTDGTPRQFKAAASVTSDGFSVFHSEPTNDRGPFVQTIDTNIGLYAGDVEVGRCVVEGAYANNGKYGSPLWAALTDNTATLTVGESKQLEVLSYGESYTNVTYTPDTDTVVEISETGLVTGLAAGTAYITIRDNINTNVMTQVRIDVA